MNTQNLWACQAISEEIHESKTCLFKEIHIQTDFALVVCNHDFPFNGSDVTRFVINIVDLNIAEFLQIVLKNPVVRLGKPALVYSKAEITYN